MTPTLSPDLRHRLRDDLHAAVARDLAAPASRPARRRRRWPVAAALAATFAVGGTALATGLGVVSFGDLRVSTAPELPADLDGVPAATLLANDANALACDGGWIAPTAVMQSPHEPGTVPGCHAPTAAERRAERDALVAGDPAMAEPLPYWYRLDTASLAPSEGRPGAAAALGPVYLGSATPLDEAALLDVRNWRVVVSNVGGAPSPTAIP